MKKMGDSLFGIPSSPVLNTASKKTKVGFD